MFNIFKGLADRTTAADIESAIAATQAAQAAYARRLHDLAAERPGLLLSAPDAEVRRHEADMADVKLSLDRATVALGELHNRHVAAVDAEEQAKVDAMLAEALADSERGVDLISKYERAAAEMQVILTELAAIRQTVFTANHSRHGRGEHVPSPDALYAQENGGGPYGELGATVRLPKPGNGSYWFDGRPG